MDDVRVSYCNCLGDIWRTDKLFYFSSRPIDYNHGRSSVELFPKTSPASLTIVISELKLRIIHDFRMRRCLNV